MKRKLIGSYHKCVLNLKVLLKESVGGAGEKRAQNVYICCISQQHIQFKRFKRKCVAMVTCDPQLTFQTFVRRRMMTPYTITVPPHRTHAVKKRT